MVTITIPKNLIEERELIVIPRKKYEALLENQKVGEGDILRWAKEARILKKMADCPN